METEYRVSWKGCRVMSIQTKNVASLEDQMVVFFDLLHSQFKLYEEMMRLYTEEKVYIEKNEMDNLHDSLRKKDEFLEQVVVLEKDLAPLKELWGKSKELVSHTLQLQIQSLIDKFKALVEKLMAAQQDNEETLVESNKRRAEELALLRKGKQVGRAYSVYGNTPPRSRYMDKKR